MPDPIQEAVNELTEVIEKQLSASSKEDQREVLDGLLDKLEELYGKVCDELDDE